jgi:hypothetical protein
MAWYLTIGYRCKKKLWEYILGILSPNLGI